MNASVVQISVPNGIKNFYCPACGAVILGVDEGLAETLCEHVSFLVDWADELTVGDTLPPALVTAIEDAYPNGTEALADTLPDTAVVFKLIEPGRGGGHDGSEFVLGLDFLPAS